MTRALQVWSEHLWLLSRDTLRVWWRCLPGLLCGLVLGTLGYHALLVLSAWRQTLSSGPLPAVVHRPGVGAFVGDAR